MEGTEEAETGGRGGLHQRTKQAPSARLKGGCAAIRGRWSVAFPLRAGR